jgi:hypothetical protein
LRDNGPDVNLTQEIRSSGQIACELPRAMLWDFTRIPLVEARFCRTIRFLPGHCMGAGEGREGGRLSKHFIKQNGHDGEKRQRGGPLSSSCLARKLDVPTHRALNQTYIRAGKSPAFV